MSYNEDITLDVLPDELILLTFRFFGPHDLGRTAQVSTRWKRLTGTPDLWRHMGAKYYGDYLCEEDLKKDPKQQVVSHFLSVVVNATKELTKIEHLTSYYRVYLYNPIFKRSMILSLLANLATNLLNQDELIALGNEEAIQGRTRDFFVSKRTEIKESLYPQGNAHNLSSFREAYYRSLDNGPTRTVEYYGYEEYPVEARKFNDYLVERGNVDAIKRKIEGLLKDEDGYEKDPSAAKEFVESLVISEFPVARAIGKYIKSFAMKYGISELGYEKDRVKAIQFIKENHVPF